MLCLAYSKSFQMCAIMQISHYFDIILAKNNEMMAKKPRTKSKNMSILPRIAVSYRIQIGLLFWIIAVFVLNGVSCYGLISIGIQNARLVLRILKCIKYAKKPINFVAVPVKDKVNEFSGP